MLRNYFANTTLLMPAHTWEWVHAGLRYIDMDDTPCCVGRIAEVFRQGRGVSRSVHPTHSVAAFGGDALSLIDGHELADSPCGAGTPYTKLAARGGQVLFLGVGLECNTLFHTVEALAEVPYLLENEPTSVEIHFSKCDVSLRRTFRLHRPGLKRRFRELEPWLVEHGMYKTVRLPHVTIGLLDAARFCDALTVWIRREPSLLLFAEHRDAWRFQHSGHEVPRAVSSGRRPSSTPRDSNYA